MCAYYHDVVRREAETDRNGCERDVDLINEKPEGKVRSNLNQHTCQYSNVSYNISHLYTTETVSFVWDEEQIKAENFCSSTHSTV